VPRELTPIRTNYEVVAARVRERHAALNGHYSPERLQARVEAAVCEESGLSPDELERHKAGIIGTVLRKVNLTP
jgi:hypothetical protein